MEGENGSERENKCKLTPRYEKTPGSRVPREEKPGKRSPFQLKLDKSNNYIVSFFIILTKNEYFYWKDGNTK